MSKQVCLIILSSSSNGVSATSFLQCFKLTQSAFSLQIATPDGAGAKFIDQDEQSTRLLADMAAKNQITQKCLQEIKGESIGLVIIPHSPGAVDDLFSNEDLGRLICHCVESKKPICAIGLGVCGLLSAKTGTGSWPLTEYSLTGSPLSELISSPTFLSMPFLPADVIMDKGGKFCEGAPNTVHVVVNRHVITGQNTLSTLSAIQNTILLANQRHKN